MPTAWINLRHESSRRYELIKSGLQKVGYKVEPGLTFTPGKNDLLLSWNRIGSGEVAAKLFERQRLRVLVAENASWGNDFAGQNWITIARGAHNTAERFTVGGPERWDDLHIDLAPWRPMGNETVLLPQRGIGSAPVAMPRGWEIGALKKYGGRVRKHPGKRTDGIPLWKDLMNASRVVTWGSGAAIQALMMGISVISEMPHWIAEQDNTDEGRLNMFRRLAWAQHSEAEIEHGFAFERLLG